MIVIVVFRSRWASYQERSHFVGVLLWFGIAWSTGMSEAKTVANATATKQDPYRGLYQSLAATSKKKRSRAFSKLQQWLAQSGGLDEQACLRLWKALFYSMYMCDKVEPQQRLAADLANLTLKFRTASDRTGFDQESFDRAFLFVRCFFKTMVREFPGIDQHRKDKFLSLIRKQVLSWFSLLKSHSWDSKAIEESVQLLEELLEVGGRKLLGIHRVMADVRLQVSCSSEDPH